MTVPAVPSVHHRERRRDTLGLDTPNQRHHRIGKLADQLLQLFEFRIPLRCQLSLCPSLLVE
ncbi:hypothetical protein [Ferrimicrobium acidiphilum]|uniref:Uncharacterized protein n=1 Tax=Ferrimicrobium acidiphilum TaxID=121039 RepID=A0ABV3XZT9_9ACTN